MLSLQIANGALAAMYDAAEGNVSKYALGNDPVEYQMFVGGDFWRRPDRPSMTRIYQAVLFSSMEFSGAEHFDAPAEWQASVIAAFVHPANFMSACSWFVPQVVPALSVVTGDVSQEVVAMPASATTLFALILLIKSIPACADFRLSFEKHVAASLLARVKSVPLTKSERSNK